MSLIFATQMTAVATATLAIFALITAVLAYAAWRKQSREVSDQAEMLRLQAEELRQASADRQRDAQERHRAQAVQVYMWTIRLETDNEVVAYLRNTSQQPVYSVQFYDASFRDSSDVRTEPPLMPGEEFSHKFGYIDPFTPGGTLTPVATFRDRARVRWRTWPDGRLEEVPASPGIEEPPDTKAPADRRADTAIVIDVGE